MFKRQVLFVLSICIVTLALPPLGIAGFDECIKLENPKLIISKISDELENNKNLKPIETAYLYFKLARGYFRTGLTLREKVHPQLALQSFEKAQAQLKKANAILEADSTSQEEREQFREWNYAVERVENIQNLSSALDKIIEHNLNEPSNQRPSSAGPASKFPPAVTKPIIKSKSVSLLNTKSTPTKNKKDVEFYRYQFAMAWSNQKKPYRDVIDGKPNKFSKEQDAKQKSNLLNYSFRSLIKATDTNLKLVHTDDWIDILREIADATYVIAANPLTLPNEIVFHLQTAVSALNSILTEKDLQRDLSKDERIKLENIKTDMTNGLNITWNELDKQPSTEERNHLFALTYPQYAPSPSRASSPVCGTETLSPPSTPRRAQEIRRSPYWWEETDSD